MNLKCILSCSLMATALAGCWSPHSKDNTPGRAAMWSGDVIRAAALNKAIVTQRVIFPYHFVGATNELNALGLRDLTVLADYYREHPGALNVRRSGAPQALYDARVVAVIDNLRASGVAVERITVADGLLAGDGISSERLVRILREPAVLQGGSTGAVGGDTGVTTATSDMTSEVSN